MQGKAVRFALINNQEPAGACPYNLYSLISYLPDKLTGLFASELVRETRIKLRIRSDSEGFMKEQKTAQLRLILML